MTRNSFLIQSDPKSCPNQNKKTFKYFSYITLSSTDLFFCNFLIIYMYVYTFESNQLGKPSF